MSRRPLLPGRTWLFVGLVCLLIVAGQAWSARQAYRGAVEAEETEVLGVARTTAAALEQFLAVARRSTASLAETRGPGLLTADGCQRSMGPLGDAFPFFANVVVVDSTGALVCSALAMPSEPVSAEERPWFTTLAETRAFSVGRPVMGPVSGTWVVVMGSPILGPNGELLGAVAGSVELLRLEEILLDRTPDPSELVTITTDDGVVVARSVDPESWVGRALPSGTVEVERRGERLLITRAEDASGVARIWGRVDLPEIGWRVYTGVPAARVRGPSLADFRRQGLLTLGLAAAAVLLALLLLPRSSSRPRRDAPAPASAPPPSAPPSEEPTP